MKMTYATYGGKQVDVFIDQQCFYTTQKEEAEIVFQILSKHVKVEYEREYDKESQVEMFILRWSNIKNITI